jgi:hypothetical protein
VAITLPFWSEPKYFTGQTLGPEGLKIVFRFYGSSEPLIIQPCIQPKAARAETKGAVFYGTFIAAILASRHGKQIDKVLTAA